MAVLGFTAGLSSAASCAHSFSASGSGFIEVLLQDELCRVRVELARARGLRRAPRAESLAHAGLGLGRSVAFVDLRHRQAETRLELARESRHLLRRGDARRRRRPAADRRPGARAAIRRPAWRLPPCARRRPRRWRAADARCAGARRRRRRRCAARRSRTRARCRRLPEAKAREKWLGRNRAGRLPLRHGPLRPASDRNRCRAAPSPPAGAPRPGCRI